LGEAADLLEESLEEETDTDEILSEIAEAAINREAV
jgi:ferritin-like metal-binding protein YciE